MLVAFLCSATVSAQWTSHISLDKCTYSAIASEGQIAGNNMGFVMHYTDGSVVKFCKGNHLTDVGISTIATNDNIVYVGYSNGNIDIVDLSKLTTTNIPELKIHTSIENRAINQIYKYGQMLYCSTSCGVIVVNLNKNEISSRYLITTPNSPTINCLTICNDTIYVGTTNGLYYASVKNNILEDISEWTRHSTLTKNISDIANFDNNIFVAMGSKGSANKIYRTNTNNATLQWEVSSYRNMSATSNALMMVATNQITTYDKNLNQTETLSSLQISEDEEATDLSVYNAQLSENGTIAMATSQHGLVVATADGYADSYTITGPIDNYSFSLAATSKGIYCSKGGVNLQYNNLSRDIGISFYHDNEWTNSKDGQRDALIFAADPNCEDSVYMTTWGKGIYKIEDGKLSTHYTAENSLLTDIFGGSNYTRTFAIAYNKRSTLFVAQAQADNGIIVKSPDGEWGGLSYPITDNQHSTTKLIFTANDNGWLIIPRNAYAGLFVFNTNGTDFDDSDDMYRGAATFSDPRCYDVLKIWNEDGEVISSKIYDIVEDKNNILWFATDVGVVTFSDDKNIFSTSKPIFEQVKVPRNDGSNLADYLLDGVKATALAVDGANRKWIGTSDNGVLLVSADGSEILEQFTESNSPLPSDDITSIVVDPMSSEVFFATTLGLVSYRSDAIEPAEKLSNIKIYPNPVRPQNTEVRMTGFTDGALIKITDINGRLLKATQSVGGMATWNCSKLDGSRASTGVYIVWATNTDGTEKAVGKILVVK